MGCKTQFTTSGPLMNIKFLFFFVYTNIFNQYLFLFHIYGIRVGSFQSIRVYKQSVIYVYLLKHCMLKLEKALFEDETPRLAL